jgi:hypothetical protein
MICEKQRPLVARRADRELDASLVCLDFTVAADRNNRPTGTRYRRFRTGRTTTSIGSSPVPSRLSFTQNGSIHFITGRPRPGPVQ